jgi:hypothetical protein
MLAAFRELRRKRQRPAHAIDENVFDQAYFQEQRELMERVYDGIRVLRLSLANYPGAERVAIPRILEDGTVWTY